MLGMINIRKLAALDMVWLGTRVTVVVGSLFGSLALLFQKRRPVSELASHRSAARGLGAQR
jgi:hypothetical protein